jgi:hypothetical protein
MIESISCEALLTCEIMPFPLTSIDRSVEGGADLGQSAR